MIGEYLVKACAHRNDDLAKVLATSKKLKSFFAIGG
jgi:hypothetical protein